MPTTVSPTCTDMTYKLKNKYLPNGGKGEGQKTTNEMMDECSTTV